jgi:Flp pilus assembly protein TadG
MNKPKKKTTRRGGFAMVEFTLVGIPPMFLTISIIEASIAMWQYHSMMYANEIVARYAAMHGYGCTQNGNTCTITVGAAAKMIANQAPSFDTSRLNVTLYTNSGNTACAPITSCYTSTTQFPSSSDNQVGYDVKFVASYPIYNPLPLMWPGAGQTAGGEFTLGSTTRQRIVF